MKIEFKYLFIPKICSGSFSLSISLFSLPLFLCHFNFLAFVPFARFEIDFSIQFRIRFCESKKFFFVTFVDIYKKQRNNKPGIFEVISELTVEGTIWSNSSRLLKKKSSENIQFLKSYVNTRVHVSIHRRFSCRCHVYVSLVFWVVQYFIGF